jgi:hypothetical protein
MRIYSRNLKFSVANFESIGGLTVMIRVASGYVGRCRWIDWVLVAKQGVTDGSRGAMGGSVLLEDAEMGDGQLNW